MKRYIRSSVFPTIYGYELYSSMSGITIMFCNKDQSHLKRCAKEIYQILCVDGGDDSDDLCNEFCEENGIDIVMDENDTLYRVKMPNPYDYSDEYDDEYEELVDAGLQDGDYVADIGGKSYRVIVVDSDSSRF